METIAFITFITSALLAIAAIYLLTRTKCNEKNELFQLYSELQKTVSELAQQITEKEANRADIQSQLDGFLEKLDFLEQLNPEDKALATLLKSSEELHNQINEFYIKRNKIPEYFRDIKKNFLRIRETSDFLYSEKDLYSIWTIYLFGKFFASSKIFRDFTNKIPAQKDHLRKISRKLNQVTATLYSPELLGDGNEGQRDIKVMQAIQDYLGGSMLEEKYNDWEIFSFYDFSLIVTQYENFRKAFAPFLDFLEELNPNVEFEEKDDADVDLRWLRLIIFGSFLRELILEINDQQESLLRNEIKNARDRSIENGWIDYQNIELFKTIYPDEN